MTSINLMTPKPQLFFLPSHSDKEWRLKEKIVALVESYLQGVDDILTFSPALPRNSAGDLVEVDVGFALVSNSRNLFEFAQVRDRKGAQGRPWIEQVLGQKHSLEFGSPIVVSSEGFTDQATRLAESERILLRELVPESPEACLWHRSDHIKLEFPSLRIAEVELVVDAAGTRRMLYGDAGKSTERNILIPGKNDGGWVGVSLDSILWNWLRRDDASLNQFISALPKDSEMHEGHIHCDALYELFFLRVDGPTAAEYSVTDSPILRIEKIDFYVEATQGVNKIPVEWRYRYQVPPDKLIAQCVGGSVRMDDKTWYGVVVRVPGTQTDRIGGGLFE